MGSLPRLLDCARAVDSRAAAHVRVQNAPRASATNAALVIVCPPMAPGLPIIAPGELRHAQPPDSLAARDHLPRGTILWGRSRAIKFMLVRAPAEPCCAHRNFHHQCRTIFATESANIYLSRCSNSIAYSITSSARASSVGGTLRPSIRAVSALMTNSNLLDCTTGRSAGFAPLRMRPT